MLNSTADVLRLSGYRTITAENGLEALQTLQTVAPDLIIADIMMPEMDGYQFFDAVRENPAWLSIPFIFLSAKGQKLDIRKGYMLGADDYITKPFEINDLMLTIETRIKRFRELEMQAQAEIDGAKTQLMNIFGHELRTPLSYIYGFVSLLQQDHQMLDDETMELTLDSIWKGTERLTKLIEDLMLLVQLDQGLLEVELERFGKQVAIGLEIQEAVQSLQAKAHEQGIAISMVAPDGLYIYGIDRYIRDAITRLLDNAIKFSKPGDSRVWIRGEKQDDQVEITIQDNGIGIEAEHTTLLFQRFQQIDRATQEQQGIGMGLEIAQRLVQLHGGSISVASQPGEGSEFTITLPLESSNG